MAARMEARDRPLLRRHHPSEALEGQLSSRTPPSELAQRLRAQRVCPGGWVGEGAGRSGGHVHTQREGGMVCGRRGAGN